MTHKKQQAKRRKKSSNFKKRSRSISTSSTEEQPQQQQQELNVNNKKSSPQQKQQKEVDKNEKEWTSVICEKSKSKRKVNSSNNGVTQDNNNEHMKNQKTVNNTPLLTSTAIPSPTLSCETTTKSNSFKKVTTTIDLNLISPESTPIHSEDEHEDEAAAEAAVFEKASTTKNWYSPFNTGLDLDIIPKYSHHEQDIIFKNIYSMNHFTSISHQPQQLTSIQLLETHPFIPSSTSTTSPTSVYTSTTSHHAFGSIGDKRKHHPLYNK